jgi:hypothetical protein
MQVRAVEAFNAWFAQGENKLVEELTIKRNLLGVAGSDVHRPNKIFVVLTDINTELDIDCVLKAIRERKSKRNSTKHHLNVGTSFNHKKSMHQAFAKICGR